MNTVPIVNNNNVKLYNGSNGFLRTTATVCNGDTIVGAPIMYNNTVNVPVKMSTGGTAVRQYDERTGMYKTTLY